MELIVFSKNTRNALKKLAGDGSYISITNPLLNSEEIYFYHHLKELGYVEVKEMKDRAGVEVALSPRGILLTIVLKITF